MLEVEVHVTSVVPILPNLTPSGPSCQKYGALRDTYVIVTQRRQVASVNREHDRVWRRAVLVPDLLLLGGNILLEVPISKPNQLAMESG